MELTKNVFRILEVSLRSTPEQCLPVTVSVHAPEFETENL